MAEHENDNIIVSRIQHRRGLKQDLPQPLRPGELGLATDSRQVYIGGDPLDPNAAPYNNVSYFENTVGARDHTISIANNNIIAFQVPYIKFVRGEFNGIQTEKSWEPADARSIISASQQPSKQYMSSTYSVFSPTRITPFEHTLSADLLSTSITVNLQGNELNNDSMGYIRVGDIVSGTGIRTGQQIVVTEVTKNTSTGVITVTLSEGGHTVSANSNITFTPRNIVNFARYDLAQGPRTAAASNIKISEGVFVSTDVTVCKNGIKLIPESNSAIVDTPSATADYVLDGTDFNSNGTHYLTLRTRPSTKDEVSICYYSNSNVIQAIEGISTGKISSTSTVDSFYSAYNIHPSRHIPKENIRVNGSTGLGYIGLQNKHIVASAHGANMSATSGLVLGNLLVSRTDDIDSVSSFVRSDDSASSTEYTGTVSSGDDIYSPVSESNRGVYRYNRVWTTQTAGSWFHNKLFDVEVAPGSGAITIALTGQDFQINRNASANLSTTDITSGFTNDGNAATTRTVIKFSCDEIDDVRVNDYVRILDATGDPANCELHGSIFKVSSLETNAFVVDLSTAADCGNSLPTFTANISSLYYLNHGDLGNVNTTAQFRSVNHELTSDVANIKITEASNSHLAASEVYSVYNRVNASNTFFATGNPGTLIDVNNTMSASTNVGEFHPSLAASYTNIKFTPVLAIDLSGVSTLKEVVSTVNKSLVNIPAQDGNNDVQIFPLMDYLEQDDGTKNAVYITQKPAYASVAVGGIPFRLTEDSRSTLSTLGLNAGVYDRNSSVRAKLEQWLNDMVVHRDVNLFTNVLLGGTAYNSNASAINNLSTYNLTIDDTFGEIIFGDREEAANYNYVTNSAYAESAYDRASDSFEGTRGLINLKNNLEIQTRDTASTGEKIVSFTSTEGTTILQSDVASDEIIGVDVSVYDSYVIEYTISETPLGSANKYMRMGTMTIQGRPDFTDTANAVIFNDRFSSHWETGSTSAVVEPKFTAAVSGNRVVVSMENQLSDPTNPLSSQIVHSLGNNLKLKYVIRRWSSTE